MADNKETMSSPKEEVTMSNLLKLNKLEFQRAPELGIAVSKNTKIDYAQEPSYIESRRVIFDVQTGSNWVSGPESFMYFKFVTSGGTAPTWGNGSALNMIQESIFYGRGGKEVSRSRKVNVMAVHEDAWNKPTTWFNTIGPVQGYGTVDSKGALLGAVTTIATPITTTTSTVTVSSTTAVATDTSRYYCVPMSSLHDLFGHMELLPPQLMEGGRLEIQLEAVATATVGTVAATGFTMTDPQIHWSVIRMGDAIQRKINEMSRNGLIYTFTEYYNQPGSTTGTASANIDVRKSVARALQMTVISRVTANTTSGTVDSMLAETFGYQQAQAELGGEYFPQKRLEGAGTQVEAPLFYQYALLNHDKLKRKWEEHPRVDFEHFSNASNAGYAQFCVNLNKSMVSTQDGYRTNNSKQLRVNLLFAATTNRTIDVFLKYVRQLQIFPNDIVVYG